MKDKVRVRKTLTSHRTNQKIGKNAFQNPVWIFNNQNQAEYSTTIIKY